jgi:hypothetical protein
MPDILICGDSITVGVSWFIPHAKVMAKVGINSSTWVNEHLHSVHAVDLAIISLGTNDGDTMPTRSNLSAIRARLAGSKSVVWLIPPIHPHKRLIVETIASNHGDHTIDVRAGALGPDHIHPTRAHYVQIAREAVAFA